MTNLNRGLNVQYNQRRMDDGVLEDSSFAWVVSNIQIAMFAVRSDCGACVIEVAGQCLAKIVVSYCSSYLCPKAGLACERGKP